MCVVVGDRGGVYVTGSGFSPMSEKGGTELGLDTVNLTPTLTPTLALALTLNPEPEPNPNLPDPDCDQHRRAP